MLCLNRFIAKFSKTDLTKAKWEYRRADRTSAL